MLLNLNKTTLSVMMGAKESRHKLGEVLFSMGAAIFLFLFIIYSISLAFFSFGWTTSKWVTPVSALLALTFLFREFANIDVSRKTKGISFIAATVVIVASMYVAAYFYDKSYDGLAYHQEAVIQLHEGWNPIHENLGDDVKHSLWINHYPKWTWIYAANILSFTASIEAGKSYQLLLGFSLLFLSCSSLILTTPLGFLSAGAISLLVVINPVYVNQLLTYYVDGTLYLLITSVFLFGIRCLTKPNILSWLMFYAASILLINTKFTGIPFYLIAILGFSIFLAVDKNLKAAIKFGLLSAVAGVLAIFIFGFDTYVKNYLLNGHPLFPLYGQNPVDIMTANTPASLLEMNRFQKFFASMFSMASNSFVSHQIRLPFFFDGLKEINNSIGHDIRISGFGFLFSGIIILGFAGLFLCAKTLSVNLRRATTAAIITILVMVFIHPEAWWARYVPQLWIVPLISIICLNTLGGKLKSCYGLVLLIIMFINSGAILVGMLLSNYYTTNHIRDELADLQGKNSPILIYFDQFPSLRYRLIYSGINFIEVDKDRIRVCDKSYQLIGSFGKAKYC